MWSILLYKFYYTYYLSLNKRQSKKKTILKCFGLFDTIAQYNCLSWTEMFATLLRRYQSGVPSLHTIFMSFLTPSCTEVTVTTNSHRLKINNFKINDLKTTLMIVLLFHNTKNAYSLHWQFWCVYFFYSQKHSYKWKYFKMYITKNGNFTMNQISCLQCRRCGTLLQYKISPHFLYSCSTRYRPTYVWTFHYLRPLICWTPPPSHGYLPEVNIYGLGNIVNILYINDVSLSGF